MQAKHSGDSSNHLSAAETWCFSKKCKVSISVHFPLVHNTTAARLEGSGSVHGHYPAEAAVADWSKHLEGLFSTDISLREDGTDVLAVSVTAGILQVCSASRSSAQVPLHCGFAVSFSIDEAFSMQVSTLGWKVST